MDYILQTSQIIKKYNNFTALTGLNMNVPRGSIYGFVGRNGAGKTTLIRIITGLNNPTSGTFTLMGASNTDAAIRQARKKMGAVVETPSLHPEMTARDNLIQHYKTLGLPPTDLENILHLVGLPNTGKKKAKNFSLVGNPEILVLDEPINGLDPQGIMEVREMIMRLNHERGITILISSHILDELSRLATHYGFIDRGHILQEISADELNNRCRSALRVTVSDTSLLAKTLDEMQLEYKVYSPQEADIFTQVKVTPLVLELNKNGCEVITMTERHESLENYFMGLVGGGAING